MHLMLFMHAFCHTHIENLLKRPVRTGTCTSKANEQLRDFK